MSTKAKVFGVGLVALLVAAAVGAGFAGFGRQVVEIGPLTVRPTLEHRTADGGLYTPSTQSLLRTHSRLEQVDAAVFKIESGELAELELRTGQGDEKLSFHRIPIRQLVPRLHYTPGPEADGMDGLNLMLAEYSRNGLSVPWGRPGDTMAHFRTELDGTVPWRLRGDFDFEPNPDYKPQRVAVINNCLAPGLWELSAVDRSGEIYHAWFDMPHEDYFDLVADVNGLQRDFVEQVLQWKEEEVPLDLSRLRRPLTDLGAVPVVSLDEDVSFSSQGSRRKLHRNYVLVDQDGELRPPQRLSDMQRHEVVMSSFMPPGIYSSKVEERTRFDIGFLADPVSAELRKVEPLTDYAFDQGGTPDPVGGDYLEMTIRFANGEMLIVGNLPTELLVRQEDFVLHGFGVGILPASDFAERRPFLLEQGPRPSYAYLVRPEAASDGEPEILKALNSHGRGLEQIFVRSRPDADTPHWTLTLSSYERIVDLAKLRIDMPSELVESQRQASERYIPPIYTTYRDDNVN